MQRQKPVPGPLDVSIVVVSYNTRDLTVACLDSILAETRTTAFEVLVIDNASSDRSAAAIRAHALGRNLICTGENLGFAGANNLAARQARGDFILLLNPDTVIGGGAIDRLVDFARARPEGGIWGGRTVFADGTLNPSSCWGRMTPWNLICRASGLTGVFPRFTVFNGEAYGGWRRDRVADVDIVSGCFLLIRRALWEQLGGFDPAFFMYGEEADLCLRARAIGARPMITPDATIVHLGGASERTRTAKMIKLLAAKVTLVRRHWHPWLQPLGVALLAAWPLSRWLALTAAAPFAATVADAAMTWREIWRRRAAWLGGYAADRPQQLLPPLPSTAR